MRASSAQPQKSDSLTNRREYSNLGKRKLSKAVQIEWPPLQLASFHRGNEGFIMSTTACLMPSGVQRVGPLTTVFTPPSTCLHNLYVLDGGILRDIAFLDFGAKDCSPSLASTSLGSFTYDYNTYDYHSPGICPFKYTRSGPAFLFSSFRPKNF